MECRDLYEILISIPLDTYPRVELLDHLVDLVLISFLFRNSTNFMGVFDVSICIPTKKPKGSFFSIPRQYLSVFFFFYDSHSNRY